MVVSLKKIVVCAGGAALLFLSGCAGKAQEALPRFVFPPPPDPPKVEFVGVYSDQVEMKTGLPLDRKSELEAVFKGGKERPLVAPMGIVSDGKGRVYVSEPNFERVWLYDFTINAAHILIEDMGQVSHMAIGADGSLYLTNLKAPIATRVDRGGFPLARYTHPEMEKAVGIAVAPDTGRVYVSDGRSHSIYMFEQDGTFVSFFGRDVLYAPQGMAFGPEGHLYVANTLAANIAVFTPEGELVRTFGERGDGGGQFEQPKSVAFDSDGNLYVPEFRSGKVQILNTQGQLLMQLGGKAPRGFLFAFDGPQQVFVDSQDRIYVAEMIGKRFAVYQYLSSAYLKEHPFTADDMERLRGYLKKRQKGS